MKVIINFKQAKWSVKSGEIELVNPKTKEVHMIGAGSEIIMGADGKVETAYPKWKILLKNTLNIDIG